MLADLLAAAIGLAAAALVTHQRLVAASWATLPLIVLIIKVGGRYDRDAAVIRKSTLDEAPALMGLAATYALGWSMVTVPLQIHSSRGAVIVLWAGTGVSLFVLRCGARALGRRLAPAERLLIMGSERMHRSLAGRLGADFPEDVEVAGFLPLGEAGGTGDRANHAGNGDPSLSGKDLAAVVEALQIDRVVVVPLSDDPESTHEAVATANAVGVKISIVPSIFEVIGSSSEIDEIAGVTMLGLRHPGISRSSAMVKRTMDVVGATLGLLVMTPFGLLIAAAIKLDTHGPVFFRQHRIGRDGRVFQMIKFRSMVDTAEQQRHVLEPLNESDGLFKMSRDPRVTRVGKFLRRTSLDELPQLINVLRGEMSLVGPRPLVPEEDQRVAGRHRGRLQFSPGMTGPWQVLGPTRPPLAEMVKLDYLYGANWSLWSDLKFILRTVGHVTGRRGV